MGKAYVFPFCCKMVIDHSKIVKHSIIIKKQKNQNEKIN